MRIMILRSSPYAPAFRLSPSAVMREARVVGFMPSNSAPPPACDSQPKRRRGRRLGICSTGVNIPNSLSSSGASPCA